jgi:hypothetical protein
MKEKIWIEKLVELLNEYDSSNWWKETDEWIDNIWKIYEFHSELQIISKKYWFIEWLVENDKIDYEKIWTKIWMEYHKAYFPINKYWYVYDMEMGSISSAEYSDYESLLMLLAIQDEPIRFLCEILK